MGRRGPLPRRESAVTVITGPTATVPQDDPPPPPPGLLAETRSSWTAFWTSSAAQWVDRGAHMQRLDRWIRDVDQWNRIQRDLRPTRPAVRPSRSPDPPAELSDGAREVWQRVVREYVRAALVADPDVLRAYCESVARYRHAEGLLASSGPLIRGRNGDLISVSNRTTPSPATASPTVASSGRWHPRAGRRPGERPRGRRWSLLPDREPSTCSSWAT